MATLTALPFLILVVVVLPLLAWGSSRWLRSGDATGDQIPSAQALAIQTILLQIVTFGLAWVAAGGATLEINWSARLSVSALLLAVVVLVVMVLLARLESKRPLGEQEHLRRRLRQVHPLNPYWLIAAGVAAISEEYCYRGVLTTLVAEMTGPTAAVAGSAVVFGLAHLGQGWRGALFSGAFALGMQLVCGASGGLALAIVVHFIYDVAAATLGRIVGAGHA